MSHLGSEPTKLPERGVFVYTEGHEDEADEGLEKSALGLHADDETYYVMDFNLMSSTPEAHRVGDKVTGAGVFTPIERLDTDQWRQYTVKWIFSVTDEFRVVK